jgi:hypothetical protein
MYLVACCHPLLLTTITMLEVYKTWNYKTLWFQYSVHIKFPNHQRFGRRMLHIEKHRYSSVCPPVGSDCSHDISLNHYEVAILYTHTTASLSPFLTRKALECRPYL